MAQAQFQSGCHLEISLAGGGSARPDDEAEAGTTNTTGASEGMGLLVQSTVLAANLACYGEPRA